MKLKAHQWLGIAAVIVFGGKLVYELTKPEPDPFYFPGALPMNETFADAGAVEFPTARLPVMPAIIQPPLDPIIVGSDAARDDLYCSGIVYAAHRASGDEISPEAQVRRDRVVALAEAGVAKLIREGAATSNDTAAIADANAARALDDYAAGIPRISEAECLARSL